MTNPTPHRATPKHWADAEQWAAHWDDATAFHCLLELRSRLTAAEQRISELDSNRQASLDSSAPTGSLVEEVVHVIWVNTNVSDYLAAREAIRAVASWIHATADAYPDTCGALHVVAQQLEQEADG